MIFSQEDIGGAMSRIPEFFAYTFAGLGLFFISYFAHFGSTYYYCRSRIGKWEVQARLNRRQQKRTFAGRYLFLDFRDCLPKWRYACYYIAMVLCVVSYVCMLLVLYDPQEPFYRHLVGQTFRAILLCNILPAITSGFSHSTD